MAHEEKLTEKWRKNQINIYSIPIIVIHRTAGKKNTSLNSQGDKKECLTLNNMKNHHHPLPSESNWPFLYMIYESKNKRPVKILLEILVRI